MKALSSQAALKPQTNYKFNSGTNLESSFDVNYYETYFREYDAQIGRFTGVDVMSEKTMSLSTYQFSYNNPIYFNDPTGAMSSADFYNLINSLGSSPNGGTWSEGGGTGSNGFGFTYGGGGGEMFGSQDEAFGFGSGQMSQNNSWGTNQGWATSPGQALNNYNGGHVTPGMVQGLMTSYLAPRNPSYIHEVHEVSSYGSSGHGFTIGYNLAGDNIGYSFYMSDAKVQDLLSSYTTNAWNVGVGNNENEGNNYLERGIQATQLGADVNATTWTAMSKIAGAGKTLGKIAEHGTVAGIALSVIDAGGHVINGNATADDYITLGVATLTGVAMATGVGEVFIGVVGVGWDIYSLFK